jgi:hypothetical protein
MYIPSVADEEMGVNAAEIGARLLILSGTGLGTALSLPKSQSE